MGQHSKLYL